ncbi:hypothetical protein V1511DRAFT_495208 [Dipodascopsis uninucleata]
MIDIINTKYAPVFESIGISEREREDFTKEIMEVTSEHLPFLTRLDRVRDYISKYSVPESYLLRVLFIRYLIHQEKIGMPLRQDDFLALLDFIEAVDLRDIVLDNTLAIDFIQSLRRLRVSSKMMSEIIQKFPLKQTAENAKIINLAKEWSIFYKDNDNQSSCEVEHGDSINDSTDRAVLEYTSLNKYGFIGENDDSCDQDTISSIDVDIGQVQSKIIHNLDSSPSTPKPFQSTNRQQEPTSIRTYGLPIPHYLDYETSSTIDRDTQIRTRPRRLYQMHIDLEESNQRNGYLCIPLAIPNIFTTIPKRFYIILATLYTMLNRLPLVSRTSGYIPLYSSGISGDNSYFQDLDLDE